MEWIAPLASAAGAALVSAAATDVWQGTRAAFAQLLGRGDPDREAAAVRRLDTMATKVVDAPPEGRDQVRRRLQAEWQVRLSDLIEDDPAVGHTLRGLVERIHDQLPTASQQWVQTVSASAPGSTAQGVMFGNIINHLDPTTPPS